MSAAHGTDAQHSIEKPLEPRFFARVTVDVPITANLPSGALAGRACDVSEGGIGVLLDAPLAEGSLVELLVWLRGPAEPPISPICQIAWNRPDGARFRVGFELYEVSDEDAAALRAFVEHSDPVYAGEPAAEPEERALPPAIARKYVPVVRSIALGLCRKLPLSIQVDDLIGAGFVGLVEAYRRHDSTSNASFSTYAEQRIRGAMLDELRALDPLSRGLRDLLRRADRAGRELAGSLGRAATRAEVAERLGVPEDVLDEAVTASVASSGAKSLEGELDGQGSLEVPDLGSVPADVRLERARSVEAVNLALEGLPPRLRQVLALYYGESLTLRDIGGVLGVTESRVSQLHKEAIERLSGRVRGATGARRVSREVPLRFRHDPHRDTKAQQARGAAPAAVRPT